MMRRASYHFAGTTIIRPGGQGTGRGDGLVLRQQDGRQGLSVFPAFAALALLVRRQDEGRFTPKRGDKRVEGAELRHSA
jgi:hypothetical protein